MAELDNPPGGLRKFACTPLLRRYSPLGIWRLPLLKSQHKDYGHLIRVMEHPGRFERYIHGSARCAFTITKEE